LEETLVNVEVFNKVALGRFSMLGTQSSNFFDFCDGHHEIYYMQRHLEAKPVVADLPDEVFFKSNDKPSSTISSSTKCRQEKESEIV